VGQVMPGAEALSHDPTAQRSDKDDPIARLRRTLFER